MKDSSCFHLSAVCPRCEVLVYITRDPTTGNRRLACPEPDCDFRIHYDQVTSRLGEQIVELERLLQEACEDEGNPAGRRRYDPTVHKHLKPILQES